MNIVFLIIAAALLILVGAFIGAYLATKSVVMYITNTKEVSYKDVEEFLKKVNHFNRKANK
jgi:uncharacterized protein YneF (UPF0154 family)